MPNETLKEFPTGEPSIFNNMSFRHLPAYARFIRQHYLVPYITEQLRISKEIKLPMLKFFRGIPEDELITMSIPSHTEFLTAVENNNLPQHFEKALQLWIADGLGILKRDEVTAEDITLASYMRKKALIKFLTSYTTDVQEALEIINEIDQFTVESDTAATNIYIDLLKGRLNEQTHFTKTLSNTTPGINYVFNLNERYIKYANRNASKFLGFEQEEIQEKGVKLIWDVVHPDDAAHTIEEFKKFTQTSDDEIISWELRLRGIDGKYVWMKNYSSVFKRDNKGIPVEIVGIILDISKEKDISEKLLIREKQMLDAQAQANLGSFEMDVETNAIQVSPQFMEIFELTGAPDVVAMRKNIHPDDAIVSNAAMEKARNEPGSIYDVEYRYYVNGKEKIIWARGSVIERNGRKVSAGTVMDVTTRHKMLKQLQESEQLFKQAQARTHIGNWTWDIPADKVSWSDEMFRVYGLEPQSEEVNYETYLAHIHPDDRETRVKQVQRVFETGEPEDNHYRIIRPDGSITILHTKSEITYDIHGKPLLMTGTCQDITEKQLLIQKLQHSEFLYKQAQAISHIGNWTWNMETTEIEWSDEMYRIYDLEPDTLISSASLRQYNHPDDIQLIDESIKTAVETKQPFDFNYRLVLNGGKIKTVHAKGEIDSSKATPVIYGTLQDITEQKETEKRLKDYQEFIEKITDVTPSIIAAYNIHTGQYSFVNDAVENLLGYPTAMVRKEGVPFITSIVHPDDIPYINEKNIQALEEANRLPRPDHEPIYEFKYRMRNKNGEYRWFHTYGTIFERNEKGLVESVLNISVDITDQELAEQALYQKNLQLQQSNTSLEEYAYVASHDLKEPLRKIATFSDRILTTQYDTLGTDGKNYLHKIIDSSKRMQAMISDLLSVSTILGNTAYEPCNLQDILHEALIPLEYKIEEGKATIEADNLPVISAVPSQFRQLFQNLIGNSLKFTRSGIPAHIKISHKYIGAKAAATYQLTKANSYLQIQLEDNGIGFDNEYASKIFAIFQRLHGKSEYEGTGIGLAICKKIVENHRGSISAKGVIGHGAIFTIIIPST